jgi:NAD(P)-dependent dehydrogenase (short-subunit alcohol dehydrogenase family)
VSVAEDVERFVKETVQTFGRIDCCFNNAGIESERSPIHLFSEENFDKVMQVNCKSVFLCMKYEIQQMLQQQANEREKKNYCIVNTASTAGMHGMPEFCAYAASKWAIIGLTKTAALEYAKNNIRVNALCPATTQTPMVERFQQKWPEWQEKTNKSYPLGRIGMPAEMAEAVVWMCSEACTWMTGHTLVIDGGQSC